MYSNFLEMAGPVAPENGPHTYIGPYTAIGDGTVVEGGEIEGSIVIGERTITGRHAPDNRGELGAKDLSANPTRWADNSRNIRRWSASAGYR
jgi:hypothetical protein